MEVINAKTVELRKKGFNSLEAWLDASPDHVYIGRDMSRFVKGAVGSKWQNPFKSKDYGGNVSKVLRLYEEHIYKTGLVDDISELRGKKLACWCKPAPCHGDVLRRLAE